MKEIEINGEKIIVREAKKKDAKEIIEYYNKIGGETDFLTFGKDGFDKTVQEQEQIIEQSLKKNNELFIVAEVGGKVIGVLSFTGGERDRTAHIGKFGISVSKEYWGNGIGENLIEYLIEWSKASNIIKKINLIVRKDNIKGIKLYKKVGFVEEGTIKRELIINGEFYDSLIMGLLIDN